MGIVELPGVVLYPGCHVTVLLQREPQEMLTGTRLTAPGPLEIIHVRSESVLYY